MRSTGPRQGQRMLSRSNESSTFAADEVSVVLQQYLATAPLSADALADMARRLAVAPNVNLPAILADAAYLDRVRFIGDERRRCGDDAPCLLVRPSPVPRDETRLLLGSRSNLAVVFAAETILLQDTIHALHLDAMAWNRQSSPGRGFNVLGVHRDWLTDTGAARGALVVDHDGRVKWMDFAPPLPIHLVLALHLPRANERDMHRRISEWCRRHRVPELTPFEAAAVADSKARTSALVNANAPHIESPPFCLIERGTSRDATRERIHAFAKSLSTASTLFAQPDGGTEGLEVECFDLAQPDGMSALLAHTNKILTHDAVILREQRGNVRFRSPTQPEKGRRRLTLRVNVAWNGRAYAAESGYAQVAPDASFPVSSRSRGGAVIGITHALSWLYYSAGGRWVHAVPGVREVEAVRACACDAALAIAGTSHPRALPHLLGIDLLLEMKGTGRKAVLTPVFLEANPRPAGLAQSREIRGVTDRHPAHRIAPALFAGAAGLVTPPSGTA